MSADVRNFNNVITHYTPKVRGVVGPEMCTKAFCKMFEILSAFQLSPPSASAPAPAPASAAGTATATATAAGHAMTRARVVHLCEAPGAFVAATNHYLRQQYGDSLDFDWTGVTLNPYYEGAEHTFPPPPSSWEGVSCSMSTPGCRTSTVQFMLTCVPFMMTSSLHRRQRSVTYCGTRRLSAFNTRQVDIWA